MAQQKSFCNVKKGWGKETYTGLFIFRGNKYTHTNILTYTHIHTHTNTYTHTQINSKRMYLPAVHGEMPLEQGFAAEIPATEMAFVSVAMATNHVLTERSLATKYQSATLQQLRDEGLAVETRF